jgi:hypothetical protein
MRSIVWFLNAKGECPAEIHKETVAVYGDGMKWQNVTKWCHEFSKERTDVHNEQRNSTPSFMEKEKFMQISVGQ